MSWAGEADLELLSRRSLEAGIQEADWAGPVAHGRRGQKSVQLRTKSKALTKGEWIRDGSTGWEDSTMPAALAAVKNLNTTEMEGMSKRKG